MSLKNYLTPLAYQQLQAEKSRDLIKRALNPLNKPPPDPIDWINKNFYLYDTAKLINLYPCQEWPLRLALARDANGKFLFNTILWSWPKKSAKSSIIAAVADYTATHRFNGSVKLIANDLKQADSRVGMYLRENIKIAQRNGQRAEVVINPTGYRIKYPSGAIIESVPVDPSGEAGGNDDMMVYSELWGWKSKAHQKMWAEMTISPTKWGNSQRWIDTYAGVKGESPILEQLYETGVKQGIRVHPEYEVYVNKAARLLAVWVTKPMLPWQTPDYYAQERGILTDQEFLRIHGNQWSDSQDAFVPIQWWENCKVSTQIDFGRRGMVMGLDAASRDDCFACVIVAKLRPDIDGGDDHRGDRIRVVYSRVWYPPKKGDVIIGQIDFDEVEKELIQLFKRFNIAVVVFDETQLVSMSQRLGKLVYWEKFDQGRARLVADKRLHDMIRDRQIEHTGDSDLYEHIANADRKPEDDKLRIIKREQKKKIDAVIALSMATDKAMNWNL